jgi:hypothetical protein
VSTALLISDNNAEIAEATSPVRLKPVKTLSRRSVLSLYVLIPISLLITGVDQVTGANLKNWLPTSPENWLLFTLFFGTPHIVASNLMLVGIAEYRRLYWRKILKWSALILVALTVLNFVVSYDVVYTLVAGWTVKHVLGQQFGIGNSVAKRSGWPYKMWEVLSLSAGTAAYAVMHLGSGWSTRSVSYVHVGIGVMMAVVLGLGTWMTIRCETNTGRVWMVANTALVLVSVGTLLLGYPFFTVLIPRIIHDSTAFMVYGVHERNRGGSIGHQPLRLPLIGFGLTIAVSLLISRLLDAPVTSIGNSLGVSLVAPMSLYVAGFLALIHYCSEAVTWKSGAPHRAHFAMSA